MAAAGQSRQTALYYSAGIACIACGITDFYPFNPPPKDISINVFWNATNSAITGIMLMSSAAKYTGSFMFCTDRA